ncbi:hypothetical protein A3A48_00265 [Candidatus Curtissbacteria bacterium RIFCSPLOWO2_01_FULL_37_9]|uniref:Glycosyl transferase family 1 n=1 Tax=Candidatus Curtissbacteria bacterium RIFCSPLOWO2_01_FULL_37_9 TaxID=1797724 RepID=A0A1F5GRZ0_9BACT|nr:MAG: hypothetical protein A3A48_00265 [Candidatus Curtissbacteria bacterium RIFCSPLOWO2_01_FULL_37_9]
MKVLHIGKFYYPFKGGIETFLRQLSASLKEKVDIDILVANTNFTTITEVIDGIRVTRAASAGVFLSTPLCPSFFKFIRSSDADIIHIHSPNPMAEMAYLLSGDGKRSVVSYHSDILRQKITGTLYTPFQKRLLSRVNRIVVATPNHIQYSPILEAFREKSVVIPYGIDLNRFDVTDNIREKVSEIKSIYGGRHIILFVGRLIYYKGVEYLIQAMHDVEAVLLIVGSGNEEAKLKNLAYNLGISEKCIFLGDVTDENLVSLYHACDIMVLPSIERSEAFGIVQIEAFACGKPVISTNLKTGVPYVNQNGKTGLVVEPRSHRTISSAIQILLSNEDMRDEMGRRGRLRAEEEFSINKMGERYLNLYNEVIGKFS